MNNHLNGALPRTFDRHGIRKRGEDALAAELAAILYGVIGRNKRKVAAGGFRVNFDRFVAHVDDDPALARRVLTAAKFTPSTDGDWIYRRGCWELEDVFDLDTLVDVVDFHRPV